MRLNLTLVVFFLLSLSANVSSQNTLSEDATISLLTCGEGDQLYSTFGHTAIRIKDLSQNLDITFHYGLFDFSDPDFNTKFLRGKLMYSMGAQKMKSFLREYERTERTVYEQILNLNAEQRNEFYSVLLENYKPENREYLYDFFFNNCATIIRDRFETNLEVILGDIQYPKQIKAVTFRDMLDEHLTKMPWTDFGIDLIIGSIADDTTNVQEQLFLPLYMHDIYKESFVGGKPLVTDENLLIDHIAKSNAPYKGILSPFNVFMVLLVLEMILLGSFFSKWKKGIKAIKIYDCIWYLLLGVGSLVLLFMWYGTDHMATKSNWNVCWMNPVYLVLFVAMIKSKWSYLRLVILAALLFNLATLVKFPAQFQAIHTASYLLVMVTTLKLARNFLVNREVYGA